MTRFMVVEPAAIVEICRFLRDDPETAMNCLSNEIGVDYKDRIEVVYELYSYPKRYGVTLEGQAAARQSGGRHGRDGVEIGQLDGA